MKSELPALVDFWASWCPPCKIVGPIVDELAEEMDGKVKVCKLNVDENPNISKSLEIKAIPTLILFKGGQAVKRMVGASPKEEIKKEIEAGLE